MSQTSNILNKFLSISIGSWIAMLIGFVSTPITTRLLSPDQFGQASIFLLVVDVLAAITLLGSDQSFIRFFYEEETSNRKFLLRGSLRISLATFGLAALFNFSFLSNFFRIHIFKSQFVARFFTAALCFFAYCEHICIACYPHATKGKNFLVDSSLK
ncbi:lipopolysaccharide biosynthesis protein [Listeria aquatica]|uniref:lipopolysaccharide biosynthesis protein n=1 Tax=Listeria aquatica TaxID=1494960 RepID=UPI0004B01A9E|nr:oligosaccharide flippase family protein [Listeria aquatica]